MGLDAILILHGLRAQPGVGSGVSLPAIA